MKRDLQKWLIENHNASEVLTDLMYSSEEEIAKVSAKLLIKSITRSDEYIVQEIWCAAQKQFLKDLLNGMDDEIDDLFGNKNQVSRGKAQLVAYISSLKAYFHSKYLLLKRSND